MSEKTSIFVDEAAMLAATGSPLPPDEMIAKAKIFLDSRGGFGADPDLLDESFRFVAPVVGPLGKEAFCSAIGSVDVAGGFPDFQGEFYGFSVDPFEGDRVWYTARGRGTNTGALPPFASTPTGKVSRSRAVELGRFAIISASTLLTSLLTPVLTLLTPLLTPLLTVRCSRRCSCSCYAIGWLDS